MPATPPRVEVEGQHIFPDDELHQLAVRWKELTAQKRSAEAMVLLEQIIIGSTPMFERLAQHEKLHQTVDLDILVSAAQEKVVKWLLKWEPKLGKLFTYFSKSLAGDTRLVLADGSLRRIDDIVNNREPVEVLSWNEGQARFEPKRVTDWIKSPADAQRWRRLTVRPDVGEVRSFFVTSDHEMLTQDGWKCIESLVPDDILYTREPSLAGVAAGRRVSSWEVERVTPFNNTRLTGDGAIREGEVAGPFGSYIPDFNWKYDVTVADTLNFLAEGVIAHNCAKNAFISELVKVNQWRKRYHTTSDSLEKFMGAEDHAVDKHDMAREVRQKIENLTCRWGDPQEIGALRFLIECIVDEDNRDRQAAIRGAAYAYGISMDMSKFFYRWALTALRSAFVERVRVSLTEQDLFLLSQSYTDFADFYDIMPWDSLVQVMAQHGGKRVKIPTLAQIARVRADYRLFQEIEASDKDPAAVAEAAGKHGKTVKSATQSYEEMCETLNPRRAGEYDIYGHNDHD